MKVIQSLLLGLGLLTTVLLATMALSPLQSAPKMQVAVMPPLRPLLEQAEESIRLARPDNSTVRNKLIALMIASIAEQVFSERLHREIWFSVLEVESAYKRKAKSSTGAVGIGQLIPSYKADFGKTCGLTDVRREDLDDEYINAYLSACYLKEQITAQNGNIGLALAAYNAGPNSSDLKNAQTGRAMGHEPAAYVSKVLIQHAKQKDKE